jgi:hypothetical protein
MSEDLKLQIRQRMLEKDTEELIAIWKKNDRTEWSDEAFEVVREILAERIGDLPAQSQTDNTELPAIGQDEDTYHNFNRLTRIASWASILSWLFLGVAALLIVGGFLAAFGELTRFGPDSFVISSLLFLWVLVSAFFFVVLQAIAEGIYLLMDIEDNTRQAIQSRR